MNLSGINLEVLLSYMDLACLDCFSWCLDMSSDNRPYGYYEFKHGERGWCKPVLIDSVAITYDDGSYTVVPYPHWCFDGAKEVKNDSRTNP